jgi:hypothetical protein
MTQLAANRNLLPLTGFKIRFGSNKFTNLEFFATSVSLPGISVSESQSAYRQGIVYTPSDKVSYETCSIQFACDEELVVYREIHDWMKRLQNEVEYSDMTLSFLTSHNNTSRQVLFKNAWPTSCSGLQLSAVASEVDYGSLDVSFRYDTFEFLR